MKIPHSISWCYAGNILKLEDVQITGENLKEKFEEFNKMSITTTRLNCKMHESMHTCVKCMRRIMNRKRTL